MNTKKIIFGLSASFLSVTAAHAAVTIINPGFEDPAHTNNDGTNPTGWTVIETTSGNNPVRQVRTRNTFARTGSMSVQIGAGNSNHDGELYQTVTTVPGQMYVFSIWARSFANNNSPGNQNPQFDLIDGIGLGGSLLASSGPVNTLSMTYAEYTVSFTASTADTTIHIQDLSVAPASDGNDIILDDVSISEIPEPSSALLGVLGCAFLGFYRRRS